MMDGTQVARCEQGQGGGRLSWDGWPATMNHTKCLRVDVVLGGFWTVDGGDLRSDSMNRRDKISIVHHDNIMISLVS